jgi:serine/threonine protein phosphatase PrpC
MLNIPYRITTESPLQPASISSCGARIQVSKINSNKRFCISSITDKGKFKEENQDNLLIRYAETALGHCALLVIADGVGGLNEGGVASRLVVEKLDEWWNIIFRSIVYKNNKIMKHIINESLRASIASINSEIFEKGKSRGCKMGTTLSLLFILDNWYCIKHAGDSRVYKLSSKMQQLTEDDNLLNRHTVSNAKYELNRDYEALANTLTKCIGVKPDIEMFELSGELEETDSFMLCTDSLYNHISFSEIRKCIYKCQKGAAKSQELLKQIVFTARKRGGSDDISSIVLTCSENSRSLFEKLIKR